MDDNTTPTGIDLIAAERRRQVEVEGYDAAHDDAHTEHQLAWAAACYAAPERIYIVNQYFGGEHFAFDDPWPADWEQLEDKRPRDLRHRLLHADAIDPSERIRCLIKAGALIAAEIDRLQRAISAALEDGADDGACSRHYPPIENRTED